MRLAPIVFLEEPHMSRKRRYDWNRTSVQPRRWRARRVAAPAPPPPPLLCHPGKSRRWFPLRLKNEAALYLLSFLIKEIPIAAETV